MRSIEELTAGESSWPYVSEILSDSPFSCEVVSASIEQRERALTGLQVTVRSVLGSLAWNCGLVSIDHGWVRLLGAGIESLEGLHVETLLDPSTNRPFEGIVAAHDVLGGIFVIHGSGFDAEPGEILYWAPDTLDWTPCGMGHADLVTFLVSDGLTEFYADARWDGWQEFVEELPHDHGVAAYPPPWTTEGKLSAVSRRPAPISEVIAFGFEAARQFG